MLKARDGLKQAHMDVLVAVFGQVLPTGSPPKFERKEAGSTDCQIKTGPHQNYWAVIAAVQPLGRST